MRSYPFDLLQNNGAGNPPSKEPANETENSDANASTYPLITSRKKKQHKNMNGSGQWTHHTDKDICKKTEIMGQ